MRPPSLFSHIYDERTGWVLVHMNLKNVNAMYFPMILLNNICSKNKTGTLLHLYFNQTFIFKNCKSISLLKLTPLSWPKRETVIFPQKHSMKCVTVKFQFRRLYL